MMDLFLCERYQCRLTPQACAERRAARTLHASSGRKIPTYPGCQDCVQGETMAAGISTSHIVPTYPGKKYKPKQEGKTWDIKTGGKNMGHQKIDDEKLQRLLAEGKYVNEIAEEFGVHHTAVRRHIKIHGLTPNSRRKHRGVAAKPAPAPVREAAVDATYKRFAPPEPSKDDAMADSVTPVQIIPVVLRLTVEVNVRVNTGGADV